MSGKAWRRLWHLGGGSVFPILALYLSKGTLLVALSTVTAVALIAEGMRILLPEVNSWLLRQLAGVFKEQEWTRPTSSTYLLLASVAVFLFFDKEVAIVSLLFLAVGDPVAATVGERFATRKIFGKSLEGSFACLLSCAALGMLLVEIGVSISAPVVLVGAASAAAIELLPLPINDNLTIPLFSASMMTLAG